MGFPQSVLVTGVTGFVGAAVARRLTDAGVRVTGLARAVSPAASGRLGTAVHPNANRLSVRECADFSVEELSSVLADSRPDVILHLAAAGVSAGGNDVDALLRGNVDLTVSLLKAAAQVGRPPFIHTGTCFEYADAGDERLTERSPVEPFSFYGATKAASVQLALGLARQLDVRLVVLRPFGAYGPGEASARLVPRLVERLSADQPIDLTDGLQIRDLMFIDDLAEAYATAASRILDLENLAIYNVCTGTGSTVREVAETVAREIGRPQELLRWGALPNRPGEPRQIVGDPSRFRSATGWEPRNDLATGLRRTIDSLHPHRSPSSLGRGG